jgi:hypothetical protein
MNNRPERENRRTIFCSTQQALRAWEAPREKVLNCDVADIPTQQFYIPEEAPVVRVTQNRPPGITIFNQETTFTCEEFTGDGVGVPITIFFGQYFGNVSYFDIPNITDEQLYSIAKKDQTSINIQLSLEDYTVIETFDLKPQQKNFLREAVKDVVNDLKSVVFEVGRNSLDCTFYSDEVTYACPNGSYINGLIPTSTFFYPYGYRKSKISRRDANDKVNQEAMIAVQSCLFGNNDVTANCPEGFYAGPLVGDAFEFSGFFTIEKNTFFEKTKGLADIKALEAAEAGLRCLYCNEIFSTGDCGSGAINPALDVPSGTICRETPEELQAAISNFIISSGECLYRNMLTKCSCTDLDPTYDDISNPLFTFTVQRGEFVGDSQAEVNALAKELCLDSLECKWCSDPIYDVCKVVPPKPFEPKEGGDPRTPLMKKCAVVSDTSKADATNEAWLEAFDNANGCPAACAEGFSCMTDEEAILAFEKPVKGGLDPNDPNFAQGFCSVELKPWGEYVFSNCWKEADDDDGGGGGGGGGDDTVGCEKDCECLTQAQAEAKFGAKLQACAPKLNLQFNPIPCKIEPEKQKDREKEGAEIIVSYCFKEKKDDPPAAACPDGCICLESFGTASSELDPGFEYITCESETGDPEIAFCEALERPDYCYKLVPIDCYNSCSEASGSLVWKDCEEESEGTTLLTWEKGLVTTNGLAEFTAGCGGNSENGTPVGSLGDIIYYGATGWTTLSCPDTEVTHVLSMNSAGIPSWIPTEECESTTPPPEE